MFVSDQTADAVKVGVSVAPAALSLYGIGLQDWVYITSAIVAIMVMIEKLPIMFSRVRSLVRWIRSL